MQILQQQKNTLIVSLKSTNKIYRMKKILIEQKRRLKENL